MRITRFSFELPVTITAKLRVVINQIVIPIVIFTRRTYES